MKSLNSPTYTSRLEFLNFSFQCNILPFNFYRQELVLLILNNMLIYLLNNKNLKKHYPNSIIKVSL